MKRRYEYMTVEVFVEKLEEELDKRYELAYVKYINSDDTLIVTFEYFDRMLQYVKRISDFTEKMRHINDIELFSEELLNDYRKRLKEYIPIR